MRDVISITLRMPPSNVNHMYSRTIHGGIFKNPEINVWTDECYYQLKKLLPLKKKDRYCVNMGFYHDNKRKNDIDSKIKIVLDMLEKTGVFENDSLVTDLIVAKRYDRNNPRLEIEIY